MTAILTVYEKPRDGTGAGNQQDYVREFEVKFSDGDAGSADCLTAVGVTIGEGHPENLYAVAYRAKAKQRDDVCFWDVTIDYKTFGRSAAEEEKWTEPDPTKRKARVSLAWESMRVAVPADRSGNVIKNSAGQVPDPRFEADAYFTAYHVISNVATIPDWTDTYRGRYGAVNSADFKLNFQNGQQRTIKKGCGKIHGVQCSDMKSENGINFFELSFNLLVRDPPTTDTSKEGWVFDMVDQGKMQLVPLPLTGTDITLQLVPIYGQDGQPVSEPVLLDGSGLPISDPTTTSPVILYWDIFASKDFRGTLPACTA